MWEFREHRVCEDFDAAGPDQYRAWREADAGMRLVRMFRTEYARWEDPDAVEPEKLGVLMVVWELVEKGCECGSENDGFCVCDDLADAFGGVLDDWDVYPHSVWEPSESPGWREAPVDRVWVSAHESYDFGGPGADTRYEYSLRVEGVSAAVRERVFGAVGVE